MCLGPGAAAVAVDENATVADVSGALSVVTNGGSVAPNSRDGKRELSFEAVTNVVTMLDLIVEARCVLLMSFWVRAVEVNRDTNTLVRGLNLCGLTRADLRRDIDSAIQDVRDPYATPAMAAACLSDKLVMERGSAVQSLRSRHLTAAPVPYERVVGDLLCEEEKTVFSLLCVHFKAVMLEEFQCALRRTLSASLSTNAVTSLGVVIDVQKERGGFGPADVEPQKKHGGHP